MYSTHFLDETVRGKCDCGGGYGDVRTVMDAFFPSKADLLWTSMIGAIICDKLNVKC